MLEKVQEDRARKLQAIKDLGFDPYGGRYDTAGGIGSILARFEEGKEGQIADAAGRLVLLRDMGKMIFAHIRDETGQMQICLRKDAPGKPPKGLEGKHWDLAKLLDLGDIVAAAGPLMKTRTGEITIFAERLTLLCKSLNPMPEKFHGLHDVEIRYRRRYLDLMTNPESMEVFRKRIAIIEHFRSVLGRRGFVEVETPMMQAVYGGAAARPFVTHHNTLDVDLFMRISPELYLKRLLVGGMGKVFEINRNFRNEGLDARHNTEFTMMELYQACADYEVMMEITEELVASASLKVWPEKDILQQIASSMGRIQETSQDMGALFSSGVLRTGHVSKEAAEHLKGLLQEKMIEKRSDMVLWTFSLVRRQEGANVVPFAGSLIDYTCPWPRRTYDELLQDHAGVSMRDPSGVRTKARDLGIEEGNKDDAIVVSEVFEAVVEPALAKPDRNGVLRPVFVKDYPAELCPLTRRKADDPSIALRFECFIAGMEIANAYTELNDPAVQEANFRRQLRGEAEGQTMRVMDEDFVTALRHGMPPAGGLGIGIDRVVMLLTNRTTIRDVVLFPLLRPEGKQ